MTIRFGSVCSGIEAASVAWGPLGWRAAWLSEIEPFPSAVLAHHYPDVPNLGDMTLLPERIRAGEVEAPDVFCGGTPCQAFSVAGLRKSLGDARGNLSLTFCEIANEIDAARLVRGQPPAVIFYENVPGILNTADNAFGCFLGALAGESCELQPAGGKWTNAGCVFGPQRAVAWRVLDAQYFGVAQRRKRVFVVASARKGFDPATVLFEFDGLRRDTPPRRSAGEDIAGTLEASLGRSRGAGTPSGACVVNGSHWDSPTAPHPTLNQSNNIGGVGLSNQGIFSQRGAYLVGQPVAFHPTQDPIHSADGTTHALSCGSSKGQASIAVAIHPHCIGRAPTAGPQGKEYLNDGSAYTMDSRGVAQAVAVAFDTRNGLAPHGSMAGDVVSQTLRAKEHEPPMVLAPAMQVRRLTPVECERLQGFPDGYTAIPWRGKPAVECPDGPRYKAIGNSWATPVVRWIGARIHASISK